MTELSNLILRAEDIISSTEIEESVLISFCESVDATLVAKDFSLESKNELEKLVKLYEKIIDKVSLEKKEVRLMLKDLKKRGVGLKAYMKPPYQPKKGRET